MPLIPDENSKNKVEKHQVAKVGPLLRPKLSSQDAMKIRQACDKGASFYIVATQPLKDLLAKGDSPILSKLNPIILQNLLVGNGIRVDNEMILNWLEGKLDASNSLVLSYCEVRVEGHDFIVKADDSKNLSSSDIIEQDSDKEIRDMAEKNKND